MDLQAKWKKNDSNAKGMEQTLTARDAVISLKQRARTK